MLQRSGDFEEWQLAERIKSGPYIDLYKRGAVSYVPYYDIPSQSKKFMKFIYEESIGWAYVDNDQ
jgi:hypothetical protein